MLDYKEIERKWQTAWAHARVFEAEPNEKEPLMVFAAFPYVNSPQHIGHIRTYGTTDTYGRYMRMQGFNVLYPMGFHATGTPLLAFAKRISTNDSELIDELKMFHVPDSEIREMTDPRYIADYFIREMESGMRIAGYGIDWRRTFVSTEDIFSKFVEWQFLKLKEKGYITKGTHPIGWCPNDKSAVGQHDTKHDVQPEIEKVIVVKFKDSASDLFFGCATYRAETIFGVTNLFIDVNAKYVIAKIKNDRYYMTKDAADNLKFQTDVAIEKEVAASELLSKKAINPIDNKEIPILPGFFVKPDLGTGVVMSVPTHAPFDYAALQRLKKENYPLPNIEYKKIIEVEKKDGISIGRSLTDVSSGEVTPEHPDIPALAYLEILHSNEDAIDDMLEFATKLAYREESHWGVMLVDEYKGMKEPEARELVKNRLLKENNASEMYILANEEPVYCRCGWKVVVAVVEQWFINYGDKGWKDTARLALVQLDVYPQKLKLSFEKIIDWIDLRAAERSQGLGTRFPFDKSYIIESLSDSTLYMAFYTFVHILRIEDIRFEHLKPEFFDYVLLSIGDSVKVSESTKVPERVLKRCKESFEYWYTYTSSHSAPDLIPNHLTMYIFNHVGLLDEKYWPKQIVVNGFVNYEGEKMSKSLGNIIPLVDGVAKYGADPLRFVEIAGADLDTTTEFSPEGINSVHVRNEFLYKTIMSLPTIRSKELSHMDYWMYSKLNTKIKNATTNMDRVDLKSAYTEIYYNSVNELKKYIERNSENSIVMREFLESVTLMLAPIMPHIGEEFWNALGNNTLVVQESWPEVNEEMINHDEELIEDIIDSTVNDIKQSVELTSRINENKGKKVKEIRIITASQWKMKGYSLLSKSKSINATMADPSFENVDKAVLGQYLAQFSKKINSLIERNELDMEILRKAFTEAKDYFATRFDARIEIESEEHSKSRRASRALPEKPSIDILWG